MTKFEILHQVIDKLEAFELSQKDNLNFSDFVTYLSANDINTLGSEKTKSNSENVKHPDTALDIEAAISQQIFFMYRYAKFYSKKALKNSALKTADEFTYLATLFSFQKLSKTELINKSIHEKPTGMEIIKRLMRADLIVQEESETDKRSQVLAITDLGKKEFFSVVHNMRKVGQLIVGDLNTTEKMQFAYMLRKLDNYHNEIFLTQKDTDFDDLKG